jgi:hypothetical protein
LDSYWLTFLTSFSVILSAKSRMLAYRWCLKREESWLCDPWDSSGAAICIQL